MRETRHGKIEKRKENKFRNKCPKGRIGFSTSSMTLRHFFSTKQVYRPIGFVLLVLMQSCALFKPAPSAKPNKPHSPFMDQVQVTLNGRQAVSTESEGFVGAIDDRSGQNTVTGFQGIEYVPPILFRYAVLMDVEVEKITNRKLFEYINQWWGVPYRIGGNTMAGIDCSAFVKSLSLETYSLDLPRTSREQAEYCQEIPRSDLREGDLVFFNTSGRISHVGLYLSNNKFVHASTSVGVVISDLNEPYWAKRFAKAGRLQGNGS
jgi:lipoprotein Spr